MPPPELRMRLDAVRARRQEPDLRLGSEPDQRARDPRGRNYRHRARKPPRELLAAVGLGLPEHAGRVGAAERDGFRGHGAGHRTLLQLNVSNAIKIKAVGFEVVGKVMDQVASCHWPNYGSHSDSTPF